MSSRKQSPLTLNQPDVKSCGVNFEFWGFTGINLERERNEVTIFTHLSYPVRHRAVPLDAELEWST